MPALLLRPIIDCNRRSDLGHRSNLASGKHDCGTRFNAGRIIEIDQKALERPE
jgi:hypothetical protein